MKSSLNAKYVGVDGSDGWVLGNHGCRITACGRRGCGGSGSGSGRRALFCLNMTVVGLLFILIGIKHEPVCDGINLAIGITNYVGRLIRTVVRHDDNNNVCVLVSRPGFYARIMMW